MLFWRITFRQIVHRPGRALLTMLSIVIGVASVVAVSSTTATMRKAHQQMYSTVTGRTSLEVVASGGGDFSESAVALVQDVPGVLRAYPGIQRTTIAYFRGQRVKLLALGLDMQSRSGLEEFDLIPADISISDDGALLDASFAKSLKLNIGESVRLLTKRGLRSVTVDGLLRPRTIAAVHSSVIYVPLKRAQYLFAAKDKIDVIQIELDGGASERQVSQAIADRLPAELTVRSPLARTQLAQENLMATEHGLQMTSGLSLLVTIFVILNTCVMSVGERRPQLAMMRIVGTTRRQLVQLLICEGLMMGALGSVLGVLVGLLGAKACMSAMEQFYQTPATGVQVTPGQIGVAVLLGVGISLLGAYLPARSAARVAPLDGLRSVVAAASTRARRRSILLGVITGAIAGSVLVASLMGALSIEASVPAVVLVLVALVLLMPLVLAPASRLVGWVLSPFLGIEARLGQRQVLRRQTRAMLTVGVLFLAVSAAIGIANTVVNNVYDLHRCFSKTLVGDFFITATLPDVSTGLAAEMPEELGQELAAMPGVADIDTIQFVSGSAGEQGVVIVVREFADPDNVPLDLREGDARDLRKKLMDGQVVIGTALSQRMGLQPGDDVALATKEGQRSFRIAGTANTYTVGGMAVYMQREVARRYLNTTGASAFVITATPESRNAVHQKLTEWSAEHGLILQSFTELAEAIDRGLARVLAALWALLSLALVVTAFGIANTLSMNVMEQTRELGMLRTVGMTRKQIRRLVIAQALIMGALGLVPGGLAGVAVGYVVNLATSQQFGHRMEFVFHPALWIGSLAAALVIVLGAAWLPGRRAANLDILRALQYE